MADHPDPVSKWMLEEGTKTPGSGIAKKATEKMFRSHYGIPSAAAHWLLDLCQETTTVPKFWGSQQLLMALNFLTCPSVSWNEMSSRWNCDPRTFEKYLGQSLAAIDIALPEVSFAPLPCLHVQICNS